jgi:uncharacterized membrane protein
VTEPTAGQRTTIFREGGLIVVFLITLVYVGVVLLTPGSPVQVPLGIVELLFAPGYALAAIMFVRRPLVPPAAEFSISVGLSVVFNVLVGLILALTGVGLAVIWLVIADTAVVWLGLIVKVVWRESPQATGVLAAVQRELRLPSVRPSYRKGVYALLMATLVAFGGIVYLSLAQPSAPTPTSLALYGPDGTGATIPHSLSIGEVGSVVVSIGDGYSNGPITLAVTAELVGNSTTVTAVRWTMPLILQPGNTSSLPLALSYGGQTTVNVTFEFLKPGDYALTFSLEVVGGTSLRTATLGVEVHS